MLTIKEIRMLERFSVDKYIDSEATNNSWRERCDEFEKPDIRRQIATWWCIKFGPILKFDDRNIMEIGLAMINKIPIDRHAFWGIPYQQWARSKPDYEREKDRNRKL